MSVDFGLDDLGVLVTGATGGIGSEVALAFARALGEFGATLTFAGSLQGTTQTLPLEIYLARESDTDTAIALSVVLIVIAAGLIALTSVFSRVRGTTS